MDIHSLAPLAFAAVLLVATLLVLAVSHRRKDLGDTCLPMAATGIAYLLASSGLSWLDGQFAARSREAAAPPAPGADSANRA